MFLFKLFLIFLRIRMQQKMDQLAANGGQSQRRNSVLNGLRRLSNAQTHSPPPALNGSTNGQTGNFSRFYKL